MNDFPAGNATVDAEPDFDPESMRARYRLEREKRLRAEGARQYQRLTGELSSYLEDPFKQHLERDPVSDTVEVTVIGGGFGGLLLGARLTEAGVPNVRIVEQGSDVGGAWYWNRYPGARCDTEAYVYLPLLEETGYMPTERYTRGDEIWAYARLIANQYGLYEHALFETAVNDVSWNEEEALWTVTTDRGDRFKSRFVCMTTGTFVRPKLPGVPGIAEFEGKAFHTSRWDYAYTGGDGAGGMKGLRDKKVAIIGTGATGVGCIPVVAESAEHLYVVQRTPAAVGERNNSPTDPQWVAELKPGWHRRRVENFSAYLAGDEAAEDLVRDGWTEIISRFRRLRDATSSTDSDEAMERADFERMEEIRKRVSATVVDQQVAEALKPYYRALCKRPCFHDEYLETFNRPNVTLIDSDGHGVERITPKGLVVLGQEYEVDCIIFASGFQTGGSLRSRLGYDVHGRDGVALTQKWAEGVSTYFGMQTAGFPNLFIVSQSQIGVSSNQTHPLDVQARHIAHIVEEARHRSATVETTPESEQWWVQEVIDASRIDMKFLESCTPSYYNNEGHPHETLFRRNGPYAPGINRFAEILDEWRASNSWRGLVFRPLTGPHRPATDEALLSSGRG